MDFSGKVVLITGASSGIGANAAKHLSKLGASLSLTGRNEKNLKETARQCTGSGDVLTVVADLTREDDTRRLMEETIDRFNRLDVLVNNAGVFEYGSFETTSLDQLDKYYNVNFRTVYHLTMLAVPHLIQTKGNIVNVSSLAGLRPFPNVIAYSSMKAALDQFTRCLALELGPRGVRVNSINPAAVATPIFRTLGMTEEAVEKMFEEQITRYPLGRAGLVSDTSFAIAFLASEGASWLTGVLLPVDGGRGLN